MDKKQTPFIWFSILLCFPLRLHGSALMQNRDQDTVAVETDILHLKELVSGLQSQLQAQEQKQAAVLSSLLSKFTSTADELSNLKSDFDKLQGEHNSTLTELLFVKDELLKSHQTCIQNEIPVSFSAALTRPVNVTNGEAVQFDHVILNSGNGYDNATGIFTCPRNGIYNFEVHTLTAFNEKLNIQLMLNQTHIMSIYGYLQHRSVSASNSVIVRGNIGDEVSVRSYQVSFLSSTRNHWYTSFSGFLVA